MNARIIILIMVFTITSCSKFKVSEKCGNYYELNNGTVAVDTVYKVRAVDYSEVMWVNKKYFLEKDITIACIDTLDSGKLIRTIGVLKNSDKQYLVSEKKLEILMEGMKK